MTDINPCPFCGGKAVFDHDDSGLNWISCTACGASSNARVSAMDDCKPLLLEQWNKRAGLQQPSTTHQPQRKAATNMASLNLTQFIGNVGQIETRYLPNGEGVTNLSLAVNDKYKNKSGELVEHTEWVRVAFFGKLSEVAEKWVKKGDPLYVSGQMKTRKWQDKDGKDRYTTEIRGDRLQMLGSKGERSEPAQHQASRAAVDAQAPAGGGNGFDDMADDVPF